MINSAALGCANVCLTQLHTGQFVTTHHTSHGDKYNDKLVHLPGLCFRQSDQERV
jgi:hypothetical protein